MKLKQFILLLSAIVFITSCGNDKNSKKNANHMEPLDIEIPRELKGNDEAVLFIETSEIAINEWSNALEDLLQDTEEFAGVPEEELSTMDKMKLLKISAEAMVKIGELGLKMSEIETTAKALENGMSEKELDAFKVIYTSFEARMVELGKKYKDYGKKTNTEE